MIGPLAVLLAWSGAPVETAPSALELFAGSCLRAGSLAEAKAGLQTDGWTEAHKPALDDAVDVLQNSGVRFEAATLTRPLQDRTVELILSQSDEMNPDPRASSTFTCMLVDAGAPAAFELAQLERLVGAPPFETVIEGSFRASRWLAESPITERVVSATFNPAGGERRPVGNVYYLEIETRKH
jgi:hypothetical protein